MPARCPGRVARARRKLGNASAQRPWSQQGGAEVALRLGVVRQQSAPPAAAPAAPPCPDAAAPRSGSSRESRRADASTAIHARLVPPPRARRRWPARRATPMSLGWARRHAAAAARLPGRRARNSACISCRCRRDTDRCGLLRSFAQGISASPAPRAAVRATARSDATDRAHRDRAAGVPAPSSRSGRCAGLMEFDALRFERSPQNSSRRRTLPQDQPPRPRGGRAARVREAPCPSAASARGRCGNSVRCPRGHR